MKTTNGVSYYLSGKTEICIYFPEGDISCRWCHLFLKYEENYKRYSCKLTHEWILDPFSGRGEECPLTIGGEL